MKVNGRTIFNMDKVPNTGMITLNTTEHITKVTNTVTETTLGQMDPTMMVHGFKTE